VRRRLTRRRPHCSLSGSVWCAIPHWRLRPVAMAAAGLARHILTLVKHVSGGTFSLLDKFLPAKCGISVTFVSIADHVAVQAAITDRTKVDCENR